MHSLDICIMHHDENFERKYYLEHELNGITVDWITEFNPKTLGMYWANQTNVPQWWSTSIPKVNSFILWMQIFYVKQKFLSKIRFLFEYLFTTHNYFTEAESPELSLVLKHDLAIKKFVNSEKDFLLIMEDDAVVTDKSFTLLSNVMSQISHLEKNQPIYVDVGSGANIVLPIWHGYSKKIILNVKSGLTRTTLAYIINKKYADLWVKHNPSTDFPKNLAAIDFFITAFNYTFAVKSYFSKISVFKHGSQIGKWVSYNISNLD